MESRRFAVIFFLIAVFVGGGYYFVFSASDSPENFESSTGNDVAHKIEQFRLVETPRANAVWVLTSPFSRQIDKWVELSSPRVIYKENSDTIAEITAREGRYNIESMLLVLRGDVVIKRVREEQIFKTEVLHWDRRRGTLETDTNVRMQTANADIEARGMFIDLAEERMELKSNVKWHWH
jgi:LPS export ABC transporter protein LptC